MNGLGAILRAVAATAAFTLLSGIASAAQTIEVLSTSGCRCCIGWARHMEKNGFETELRNLPMADLMQVKIEAGLKPGQTSCHTGRIGGYVIEGHVPAREVQRLLASARMRSA